MYGNKNACAISATATKINVFFPRLFHPKLKLREKIVSPTNLTKINLSKGYLKVCKLRPLFLKQQQSSPQFLSSGVLCVTPSYSHLILLATETNCEKCCFLQVSRPFRKRTLRSYVLVSAVPCDTAHDSRSSFRARIKDYFCYNFSVQLRQTKTNEHYKNVLN